MMDETNSAVPVARGRSIALVAGSFALAFSALSLRSSSVGWLFCCAVAVVASIAAMIFGGVGLAGRQRIAVNVIGILLGISALVVIYLSYGRVAGGAGV
jgi:hypothetical protein